MGVVLVNVLLVGLPDDVAGQLLQLRGVDLAVLLQKEGGGGGGGGGGGITEAVKV